MQKANLEALLNRVGKRVFIEYYYQLKDLAITSKSNQNVINRIDEIFTDKSKASRTSKAKRIFREGLQIEALESIVQAKSNKVDDNVRDRAKQLLINELTLSK